jgi:hypothetical protein
MNTYVTLSRAQAIAVVCPTCAAEPGEVCWRDGVRQGSSHVTRLSSARAHLTRQRTDLRDAERSKKFLKP